MDTEQQILEQAARDGSIDIEQWPRVLENVLERLRHIINHDFPIPAVLPYEPTQSTIDPDVVISTPSRLTSDVSTQEIELPDANSAAPPESQESHKENQAPVVGQRTSLPAYTPHSEMMPPPTTDTTASSQPPIPPDLLRSFHTSEQMLKSDFSTSPPYTIQRLAELVLHPTKHYRFLPAYLRALDRVVSVSSPVSDFPLVTHGLTNTGSSSLLPNGDPQINGSAESLGSDESLGGALLTPIPWLNHSNEILVPHTQPTANSPLPTIHPLDDDPPGSPTNPASPPTTTTNPSTTSPPASAAANLDHLLREQGGVSQGELLRREQEAGVVPVDEHGVALTAAASAARRGANAAFLAAATLDDVGLPDADGRDEEGSGGGDGGEAEQDEERVRARGPAEIGVEDTGPQPEGVGRVIGLSGAGEDGMEGGEKEEVKEEEMKD